MKAHCWIGTGAILLALAVAGIAARPHAPEPSPLPARPEGDPWQDDALKPPAKRKVEGKLEIEQMDGRWRFMVRGTTDLPDGVQLKVRVFVLEHTTGPRGEPRIDDEQISSKRDGWARRFETAKGAFEVVAYDRSRKPFSLEYQARISYERAAQDGKIADEVGEEDFEVRIARPPAAPKDLEIEFREAAKDISGDLEKILLLFGDLKAEFVRQQAKFDKQAWSEWKKTWTARVQAIDERNTDRWDLWAAWMERQGRFRVDGMCSLLGAVLELCDEGLHGSAEALKRAQREFQSFMTIFQESRELVGLDAPFDIPEVAEQLKRYLDAIEALRKIAETKDAAAWTKDADTLRAKARAALIRLSAQRLIPRRGYDQVLGLTDLYLDLESLFEKAASGQPADLAKSLEAHERKIKAFRDYAGIK